MIENVAAAARDRVSQGVGEPAPVDDARGRHMEPAEAADLRLDFPHRLRAHLRRGHAVGPGPLGDGREPGELRLLGRHDQLAADLVRDRVLVGEGDGVAHPLAAQPRLVDLVLANEMIRP